MFATIGHDAITLHYQPIAGPGGVIVGMEALMRWHHQQRGPISPEAFIPIFEQSGMIVPLSRWALGRACEQAASWERPLQVAVNLSAIQFDRENLFELVRTALGQSRLVPERLELEVTAPALAVAPERTIATMRDLRARRVEIALAGFTGDRASLALMKDFPFSKVKIARELVAQLETAASARSIVGMIVELAHARGLTVAAEGVETAAQKAILESEGCDWLQGYLIGRPAPIDELAGLTGGSIAADAEPDHPSRPAPLRSPSTRRARTAPAPSASTGRENSHARL